MEKFCLKNGKEVQIGDVLAKVVKTKHPLLGEETIVKRILVTERTIPELLKAGVIFKLTDEAIKGIKDCRVKKNELSLDYYIEKLAWRFGWKPEKMANYLNTIDSVYPAAAFSMILREIAIELDKKYEDHIENSPEIYVISMLDGRITKANKAHIKNYRNFAAFRSISDAKIACSIMKDVLKDLFKNK